MDYSVEFKGAVLELPKYSLAIAEKIERLEKENPKLATLKEKLKNMYKLLEDIIGKEQVESVLGKFEESDPNEINILYFKTVKCFNKPVEDYQIDDMKEQMDGARVSELVSLLNAVSNSNIQMKSNGVPFKVAK